MNTKQIGDVSEAVIAAELLKIGVTVLRPMGDNERYDMVIEVAGVFYRIQCKTARLEDGSVVFPTRSTYAHRSRPGKSYLGEVEYIFAYCPQTDVVYYTEVNESTPVAQLSYRVDPMPTRQTVKRQASDFEIGTFRGHLVQLNMGP